MVCFVPNHYLAAPLSPHRASLRGGVEVCAAGTPRCRGPQIALEGLL